MTEKEFKKRVSDARNAIRNCDVVLVGACSGLAAAEGYNVFADNVSFRRQFGEFRYKYSIRNVTEGLLAPSMTRQDYEDFLRRLVKMWVDEYMPSQLMKNLHGLICGKPYFIVTSNADQHLDKTGFFSERIWATGGTFKGYIDGASAQNRKDVFDALIREFDGKQIAILEIGATNADRLVKLPLVRVAMSQPNVIYISVNNEKGIHIPSALESQHIALPGDIDEILQALVG